MRRLQLEAGLQRVQVLLPGDPALGQLHDLPAGVHLAASLDGLLHQAPSRQPALRASPQALPAGVQ